MGDNEVPVTQVQNKTQKHGHRHVQALLMFFGMVFVFLLRVNISAAIVPLTETNKNSSVEQTNSPTYDWDASTKSLILSSFFWGYVIGQVPCGLLAKRFGAKIVLGLSTIMAGVITVLHPVAIVAGGWKLLCALRVFSGLTQAALYPCMHTLMVKWVPRTERGFLATVVYSGAQLGVTIILGVSGAIFNSMGWPGIFYVSGGMALIWALIFLYFASNEPAQSKYITKLECDYIESLTDGTSTGSENLPVPWKAMFTSLPFLGLITAQCAFTWGFYTLLTQLPLYMSNVLQLDLNSNAVLSALPYFAMWIFGFIISPISDWLVNRRIISVTACRKLCNSVGEWIPMICLIMLGYVTMEQKVLAVALLTVAVGCNAATYCGYLVNHMDLSPNFAGVMLSISNCLANLWSIFAPLLVGVLVKNEKNPEEWRLVFFIAAGVYLICNGLFVIFGKATIQSWNEPSNFIREISLKSQSKKDSNDTSSNLPTIESELKTDNGKNP